MATSRLILPKALHTHCFLLLAFWLLCAPLSSSATRAQEQPTIPAQFHVPTEAEQNRSGKLFADAIDIYIPNPTKARELLRQSMQIYEQSWGPEHPQTGGRYTVAAFYLRGAGWFDGAEEMSRRAVAIYEKFYGLEHDRTAAELSHLATILDENNQPTQAEALYRAALAVELRVELGGLGPPNSAFRLAKLIAAQGRFGEAQPFFDQSLAMREKLEGPTSALAALSLQGVGENLFAQGKYKQANDILARAARIPRGQFNSAPRIFPEIMTLLGRTRAALGDTRGADAALEDAVKLTREALAKGSWYTGDAEIAFGDFKRRNGQPADASRLLRAGCKFEREMALVGLSEQRALTKCMKDTVLALRGWATTGGSRGTDSPKALAAEAFEKVQYAELFESGYALARYGARVEAVSRGVGPAIRAYDEAQHQYLRYRRLYADSFSDPAGAALRPALVKAIEGSFSEMLQHRNQIRLNSPLYWTLQQPEAIELRALQSREGNDARLLGQDEALIVFMIPPGDDYGVVFAITKSGFEWAETRLTGAQIAEKVIELRSQIDSKAYGATQSSADRSFDRKAAHDLYLALFGDRAVAQLIADKPNWLMVPSGPLTSLPPGLLVTAAPPGGRAADSDPTALRQTKWLLRDKAITILPAVASLRTLRQLIPARRNHATAPDRLVAFADPDFAGASYGYPPPPPLANNSPTERGRPRAIQAYFRGDQPLSASLRTLDRLKGTGIEAEAVRVQLGAPKSSVFSWNLASETGLRQLDASGRLERAQVVVFATHGLVAGDLGLAQPALALSAPGLGADPALDDGLLTAAEAVNLTLNANWVILSACNTAAPETSDAQGLSGLVRGFFNAGARTLLVSHWRVRDDVAPILIPDTLARIADGRAKTKAEALRQASLAILDDTAHPDFANPFAWAPFVLIGETVR